jgi:hypothetical protein
VPFGGRDGLVCLELERRLQRALGRREALLSPWEASAVAIGAGEVDWLAQIERDFGGDLELD